MDLDILYRYKPASMDTLNRSCIRLGTKQNMSIFKPPLIITLRVYSFFKIRIVILELTFFTKSVRISYISRKANANSSMVFGFTFSILPTRMSKTWILTFFLYTCKMVRTFRINNTFRFWR